MKLLRQYSPLLPVSSWPLYQKVFENEHAMATPQRTAATHTSYPVIGCRLGRDFDSNNLVLGPTVRTIKRHRLRIRHMRRPPNRRSSLVERKPPNRRADLRLNHIRQIRLEQRNLETERK